MKYKRYDEKFNRNAANMLVMGGRPREILADELGVSDAALRIWRDRYLEEAERYPRGEGMPTPHEMAGEISRLKKELAHVTWQLGVFKKATSILSEKSQAGML